MTTMDRRRRAMLAGLAALPTGVWARMRVDAPALLLAHDAPAEIDPGGFLVSEKLDGVRAFWDGHSLRFRSGLPIPAPRWFVDRLPARPLDGELWLGRGRFDALSASVRRADPQDAAWRALRFMVFELPDAPGPFVARAAALQQLAAALAWAQLQAVDQTRVVGVDALNRRLDAVVRAGGEGLMLHRADAPYITGRSHVLLKLKPLQDTDGVVIAHVAGKGRLDGTMGALRLRLAGGREFQLGSGFSDAQRADPPLVGSVITFTHRGTTGSGLPRFASFLRVRALP